MNFGTKLQPYQIFESAEQLVSADSNTIIDSVVVVVSPTQNIVTKAQLLQDTDILKKSHLRPIGETEYNELIQILNTSQDFNGNFIYEHEKAAIARVIKENYEKFFPGSILPKIVENYFLMATSLSNDFAELYNQASDKYRLPLTNQQALDKVLEEHKKKLPIISVASTVTFKLTHPMLKYGLLKDRKNE